MQRDAPDTTPTYAAALLTGFLVLVGLGLLGLPMQVLILGGFAVMLLGTFAYAAWDVLAHRKASGSQPQRSRPRASARSRRPGVGPVGAHQRRPDRRRAKEEAGSV